MKNILELQDISFARDNKDILNHINLTIDTHKFIAITGPNGSGKSTLIKLLLKELDPTEGKITINGKDIDESLKSYIERVQKVEDLNKEIIQYCERLDKTVDTCIRKVGIVRYNAFKDVGSNLSFTLALLDNNNNGVVLNGIYSREMSNIYAKPIEKGQSKYILSEEEKEAVNKAINHIK